jgi:hypothetical protein
VDARANNRNPIPVELLLVADEKLAEKLEGMSAEEWFLKGAQILLDQPKEGTLTVRRWEWVPGQVIPVSEMTVEPEVKSAIIFARYSNSDGEHRAVLNPRRDVNLTLGETTLKVSQPKR